MPVYEAAAVVVSMRERSELNSNDLMSEWKHYKADARKAVVIRNSKQVAKE